MANTTFDDLIIDDQAAGIFRVNRRVFTEPEYLELERERIFEQCWIYAGHVSEVPDEGDFRARRVAGRPVIIVRGDDGVVRVLLNTCTHRGALVCRQRSGSARTFQCPYHAWTYNNHGELIGVPGDKSYSVAFDRGAMGLHQAPRIDTYRGFIFVNFNSSAQDLNDYLGGAKEYLDLVCDQSEAGMRITEGTQAYSIRANWKLLVENSFDGYHGLPTHQRYMNFLAETGIDLHAARTEAWQGARDLGNGHAVIEYVGPWGRPIAHWVPSFGEHRKQAIAAARTRIENRVGAQRATRICETSRNLHIFPNLVINDIMSVTVRTFFPVSPGYMEVNAWSLAPADDSPEDSALRLDNFLTFLGPGGYATPDDVEMLESCQLGFANLEVAWSDISRGMKRTDPSPSDELQIRAFWRRWHELISGSRRAHIAGQRAA